MNSPSDAIRLRPIRRIVTGADAQGQSIILSDGPSPHRMTIGGAEAHGVTDLWRTGPDLAHEGALPDPCGVPVQLMPPRGGTVFRIVEIPPDDEWMKAGVDRRDVFGALGETALQALSQDDARHALMHKTATIDYAVVLAGEVWALLDRDETKMLVGDVLIQRGTNHGWANRSSAPCLIMFVLVDAPNL